jgi:hypothetical protein
VRPCDCSECSRLRAKMAKVPEHLRDGLLGFVVHHEGTGGFLEAVLTNDLARAVLNGDPVSRAALVDIVLWLRDVAAIGYSCGSKDLHAAWRASKPVVKS